MCECACVRVCWGRGGSGATLLVIIEGGGPELELSKDWRRLLSLVSRKVYCSSDSDVPSWFLAVVLMTLDPMWKDSGFFHLM